MMVRMTRSKRSGVVDVATKRIKTEVTRVKKRTHIKVEVDNHDTISVKEEYDENRVFVPKSEPEESDRGGVIGGIKVEPEDGIKPEIKLESKTLKPLANAPNVFPLAEKSNSGREPARWNEIYNEVVYMRSKFMAPVDTQGCERMPETINKGIRSRDPRVFRFQLLVSLMLSSQTKDEVNFDAMNALHHGLLARGFSDGLALESMLSLTEKEIDSFICKVGFHNRKSVYIKTTCELLRDKFGGDIPNTIEDIVSLPGVGPKMGYLLLQNAWGINTGIGVDVHLHRLAEMWKWTKNAKNPEQTRNQLEDWLPKKYWGDINPLLVGFGQAVCVPKANNCDVCTLGSKGLCSAVNRKLMNAPMTEKRLEKLGKQRADLSQLVLEIHGATANE